MDDILPVVSVLSESLKSPSHQIRQTTIQIIQKIYSVMAREPPKLISECLLIETIPLDVSNARNLTMHIRNLGSNFAATGTEPILDIAIPRYLFGLLTLRFQPAWEAAIGAIDKISEKDSESVWNLAYEWISFEEPIVFTLFDQVEPLEQADQGSVHFFVNCTNLVSILTSTIDVVNEYQKSEDAVQLVVRESTQPPQWPPYLRSQCIKVLAKLPRLAEKHSRSLVPFLLWDEGDDDEDQPASIPLSSSWTVKDRIALLDLFSSFSNPKSLYRSEEVYNRYLYLLGHRTVSVQKIALKCVFSVKDPQVLKYRENLNGLLDDTQFKDELTSLVRYPGEEGTIHQDDRSTVLPLVIRILFGRAQTAKGGGVKQGRRFAVLNSLNNVEDEYIRLFVELSAERLQYSGFLIEVDGKYQISDSFANMQPSDVSLRRELGFVTMVEGILEQLREKAYCALDVVMEALLISLYRGQRADEDDDGPVRGKNVKSIRQLGLKCLTALFVIMEHADWTPYFGLIFDTFIAEKLDKFAEDNLQQPSALMRLFLSLSTNLRLTRFLAWNHSAVIRAFFNCVSFDDVKDPVVEAVLNCMENVLQRTDEDPDNGDLLSLMSTGVPIVLSRMSYLFERESSHQLLDKEAALLVKLLRSGYHSSDDIRQSLISVSLSALDKNTSQVRIGVKVLVLEALSALLMDGRSTLEEVTLAYDTLSKLFRQFSNRQARVNLSILFEVFGRQFSQFSRVAGLVVDLNSYSTRRIDLPDFDRRLAAFANINEGGYLELSAHEWVPLVYNMLYFMKDPEELALRTNATYSIKRFVDCFSSKTTKEEAEPFIEVLESVILPILKTNLRESSDMFRSQFIDLLGYIVLKAKWYAGLDDMKCLLFHGDEEMNFFLNVVHIQMHRRRRAVRRLGVLATQGQLKDTSIAHYILPIVESYVEGGEGEAQNLAEDSIGCIGILVRNLTWNQYRAITKRYVAYVNNRAENMKVNIKLIDIVSDALIQPDEPEDGEEQLMVDDLEKVPGAVKLVNNLPSKEKLSAFITDDIVPTMHKILTKRNDDEDLTARIPLAIPIIKFIKALPEDILELKLPGILTGLCQILRAKSQELRDMMRSTLGKIARILGPHYFVFMVRELKGALRRGAQLHVLGYTVHALLAEMKESLQPNDLNSSAGLIADIIMEDTFGTTGGERDEEGYTTDMKEVKQHKSYDSGQILATNVSLATFADLIEPIKTLLLYEKLNLKIERKVEELLRRYALGLYHNVDASSRQVLVMCFELHGLVSNVESEVKQKAAEEREKSLNIKDIQLKQQEEHFMVNLDSRNWGDRNSLRVANLHILERFIMDMIRTVLGKNEHLMAAENVVPFIPMLEAGLEGTFEDVQIAALRLLTFVIKLPLPGVAADKMTLFGRRTLSLIKSCSSTNSELCQASLRFVAALIRQKKEFVMKDSALAYVLNRLKPDLEEPDRQGITFTFLKAVLSRNVMIPEVYDVMDQVATVMVTNQSRVTREACRSAYFQFLTEYPQGKNRLKKQLQFLVANLEYPASSGRLSVMEVIHLLLTKVGDDQIQDVTASFFVALVLVLINDEAVECRETAATIIKELLDLSKEEQRELIERYCSTWLNNTDQELLLRGGLQVAGIYFVKFGLHQNTQLSSLAESTVVEILKKGKSNSDANVNWETVYFALQLVSKIVGASEQEIFSSAHKELWGLIEGTLLYPHPWVRLVASRLMGQLYSKHGTVGFEIEILPHDLQTTAFKLVRQLGAKSISQDLAIQIVKNLVFICSMWEQSASSGEEVMHNRPTNGTVNEVEDDESEDETALTLNGSQPVLTWLVGKVSSVLRAEKDFHQMIVSKKASIQLLASIIQMVSRERLDPISDVIIMAFFIYSTSDDERFDDLRDLCREALNMLQAKLGTTDYLRAYSNVQQAVSNRRIERKSKRAIQAVTAPEVYARKKLRKNLGKREKRKHVKDESGFYHGKKRKS
jgi:U3 small nucleolar RNA-associated protein 20